LITEFFKRFLGNISGGSRGIENMYEITGSEELE
jgi:hypothetical protein